MSIDCLFSLNLRFSLFLVWWIIYDEILVILPVILWDSDSLSDIIASYCCTGAVSEGTHTHNMFRLPPARQRSCLFTVSVRWYTQILSTILKRALVKRSVKRWCCFGAWLKWQTPSHPQPWWTMVGWKTKAACYKGWNGKQINLSDIAFVEMWLTREAAS